MNKKTKAHQNILNDAESILQLHSRYEELKKRLADFQADFEKKKRNYLTPSEDEKLRQIFISYWQIRSALFDIIFSAKANLGPLFFWKNQKYTVFMVAYAATVTLVDFARFLYETCDATRVIRKKIDEPDKEFCIPANSYDRIQESLISPTHLWQINEANLFYKKSKDQLETLSKKDKVLSELLKLIQALQGSADINKEGYIKNTLMIRLRSIGHFFTKSAIQRAIYSAQESVSKGVGHVKTKKDHMPHLPKKIRKHLKAMLQPGDILVTRKDFQLTNYFLPGYWPHAALYMGDFELLKKMKIHQHPHVKSKWNLLKKTGDSAFVLESLKDGVNVRPTTTPFTCDAMTIIRPKIAFEDITKAIHRGLKHEGKPYDFDFDFKQSERLVCTAVVYRSYEGMAGVAFELKERAGRMTLSAEDLLKMAMERKHFEPVATYCPYKNKKIVTGFDVDKILQETIGKKV